MLIKRTILNEFKSASKWHELNQGDESLMIFELIAENTLKRQKAFVSRNQASAILIKIQSLALEFHHSIIVPDPRQTTERTHGERSNISKHPAPAAFSLREPGMNIPMIFSDILESVM